MAVVVVVVSVPASVVCVAALGTLLALEAAFLAAALLAPGGNYFPGGTPGYPGTLVVRPVPAAGLPPIAFETVAAPPPHPKNDISRLNILK